MSDWKKPEYTIYVYIFVTSHGVFSFKCILLILKEYFKLTGYQSVDFILLALMKRIIYLD